jgi:serine/threonine protein kinase
VAVIDTGIGSGVAYLVMELLQGHSLSVEIEDGRRLPPQRALAIARPLCRVLAEAHAVGVLHRDIKPANVFLHRVRDEEVVKLVDFGIARLVRGEEEPAAGRTQAVGTPHYLAPERLNHDPYDGRADVYSLGVTLFRMLAGALPHAGPLAELNPEVSPALAAVVTRALATDPALRPTALELEGLLASLGAA